MLVTCACGDNHYGESIVDGWNIIRNCILVLPTAITPHVTVPYVGTGKLSLKKENRHFHLHE